MKAIWRVFRYEFLRQFNRKSYQLITFAIPVLAVAIFLVIQGIVQANQERNKNNPPEAPVIAEDSPLKEAFTPGGYVDLSGLITEADSKGGTLLAYPNKESGLKALDEGAIGVLYVIQPDYLATGKIDYYFERMNLQNAGNAGIRALITSALVRQTGKTVDPLLVVRLQDNQLSVTNNTISVQTGVTEEQSEARAMLLSYTFSFLLMISAFGTSAYLMQSVVEEKENRMVEILLSSTRPRELLMGKFLGLGLIGLLQTFAWAVAVLFIISRLGNVFPDLGAMDIRPDQIFVLAVYFLLGYLFFGASYAALGAIATNMREGPQYALFITLPAILPYYFAPALITAPSAPLAVGMSLFPLTAPIAMVMRAAVSEIPVIELILGIGLMIAAIIGMIWFAGRLFRVNNLLSGQAPKLRDILRLVRENV